MYFVTVDRTGGGLVQLRLVPMQIRKMRLRRATARDAAWLADRLGRVSMHFGTRVEMSEEGHLFLRWG